MVVNDKRLLSKYILCIHGIPNLLCIFGGGEATLFTCTFFQIVVNLKKILHINAHKWTQAVQTHVFQGSSVLSIRRISI